VDEQRAQRLALKREVLMRMPLFGRLSERELMRVMQVAEVRPYEPGQQVIRDGDRGDELFIMLSGQVKVLKGEAVLSSLGRGEHFGEMALIRSQPRSADVVAESRSEILAIKRSDFFEILRTYYDRYKGGNAYTGDFIGVAEEVSGEDLSAFFDGWLYDEALPPKP